MDSEASGNFLKAALDRCPGFCHLFSSPPGTGKTMAACLLPKYLARDVYPADLSVAVSKYSVETKKNLARASDRFWHTRLRLLLDEADAIFGNRSEARDGQDRYAKLEATY